MNKKNMIAFDCGNSSFRVILGNYDGVKLSTRIIDQIPNQMILVNGYFYWDILYIYNGLLNGLKKAVALAGKIDSIGICTWGVDFAFFSKDGNMLNNPCSYRNTYGQKMLDRISEDDRKYLFRETGIICDRINSVFLLKALEERMPGIFTAADKLLMIPDILNYLFTGTMINEPSELSTTQLMDTRTGKINEAVCSMFSINPNLFCSIGQHGTAVGYLTPEIRKAIMVDYDVPVICVPSHDTAAAVLAVPATADESFAFISAGTWALIGTELKTPIISDEVMSAGLTNEVGAFGTITLLKNNAGMFILQKLKNEYEQACGNEVKWEEIDLITEKFKGTVPLFPVNDSRYFNPISMSETVWNYFQETGQVHEQKNWSTIFRSVNESLACSFVVTITEIEKICRKKFDNIYIVGGGSKNRLLGQLTANFSGKNVLTGGKESTSLGNILTQLKYFYPNISCDALRELIVRSIPVSRYQVQQTEHESLKRYQQLLEQGGNQK